MRILVTGAAGFIGSHSCDRLLASGHEVTGLDAFDPVYSRETKERNLRGARVSARFRLVEGDLLDDALADALAPPPDVVVHMAAKTGVRPSIDEPVPYLRVNLEGTARLLEAMERAAVQRLVFASSSSVYGERCGGPFREDDRVDRPISVYAMTKKAGEELVHVWSALHGIRAICLRLFTVYGPRQRPEMAIHRFTRRILEGREVPLFGDGSMERDFTYVDDVVDGVVAAVDRVADVRYEIVNLGNGRPVSLRALVAALGEAAGIEPTVVHRPVPPGDVPRTFADVGRARELLGYEPRTTLGEGLERFVAWYREVAADDVVAAPA